MIDALAAARRLAHAARGLRKHGNTDNARLLAILEDEIDMALRLFDDATASQSWDGSEPCRECGGTGSIRENPAPGHLVFAHCYLCGGTGLKDVLVYPKGSAA